MSIDFAQALVADTMAMAALEAHLTRLTNHHAKLNGVKPQNTFDLFSKALPTGILP